LDNPQLTPSAEVTLARLHVIAEGDRVRTARITIANWDEYETAGLLLRDVKKNKEEGLSEFNAIYEPLWQAVKALRQRRAEVIGPWEAAEERLREAMTDFHVRYQKEQEEKSLAAAEEAMAGIDELTDPTEILDRAATAKAELQKIQTLEPEPEGISYREHWVAKVENIRVLAAAVGDGSEDEDLIQPNMKRLQELARSLRGKFQVPGCSAENRPVIQVRS